jgi:membrane protein
MGVAEHMGCRRRQDPLTPHDARRMVGLSDSQKWISMQRIVDFLERGIWRMRIRTLQRRRRYVLLRALRVLLLAIRGFDEDRCQLRASALTFYSLLSIVPVFAMAFGIAKGFGLDDKLNAVIANYMQGQEAVLGHVVEFSRNMLLTANGGVVGGIGVALLFWSVIKVLGNIEHSFNVIWGVKQDRNLARRISDYLSVMLICPILLIVSSSATVFVTSQVQLFADRFIALGPLREMLLLSLSILPYLVIWTMCTFLYMFMPNTRVSWKAGITAGIIAGSLFQLVQWIYITFQVGVAKYNAVYGSFAALPLFLVWLQFSWLVILFGAELSFAVDNDETYEFERDCESVSEQFRYAVALKVAQVVAQRFARQEPPLSAVEVAHQLEAPIRLIRDILNELEQAGVLAAVVTQGGVQERYQPARDVHQLTIHRVLKALRQHGSDNSQMIPAEVLKGMTKALEGLDAHAAKAPQNRLLIELDQPAD